MAEFKMPSLGADMEAGILYDWRVKPGDHVQRGDIIAAVETDKGVIDIEVFQEGVVEILLVEEGVRVPVGAVIAMIGTEEAAPTAVSQPKAVSEPAAVAAHLPPIQKSVPDLGCTETRPAEAHPVDAHPMDQPALLRPAEVKPPPTNGKRLRISPAARKLAAKLGVNLRHIQGTGPGGAISRADVERAAQKLDAAVPTKKPVRISPVARRLAAELDVDLSQVKGTGPNGAIVRTDVEQAAQAQQAKAPTTPDDAPAPKPEKVDIQAGMRRAIAAAMSRSNRDIPHYYLETRINMTDTLRWLEGENQKRSLKERLLPVVLLIKATAKALANVPDLNGYWREDQFQPSEAIHIGFAIALRQGGLVTPAIHHADLKSLDELMAAMRDLIVRTRSGRLRSSELTDATVTLTSLGDRGVEKVFGVIYPPQVALVGFGKVAEQPWAENGMVGVRQVVTATLAADHRASDGHRGGLFLDALANYLQEPEKL